MTWAHISEMLEAAVKSVQHHSIDFYIETFKNRSLSRQQRSVYWSTQDLKLKNTFFSIRIKHPFQLDSYLTSHLATGL